MSTETTSGTINTLRHPHASTITPVTIGADAGPKAIIPLPIARNVPSRCEGTISKIAFIMSGIKIPVPTA